MTAEVPTVVSTTPSGTEILFALGVEPAAVSHACDFPPRARALPTIDSSRVDGESSARRDEQAAEGDVYDVDGDLLGELAPDLIVTQSVCGVCAVDEELVAEHAPALADEPDVLPLQAGDLGDVYDCVREVGRAVDRPNRAEAVVDQVRTCVEQVGELTEAVEARPDVVVLEWMEPLHVAANWVPELVAAAGGRYPLAAPGERSRAVAWERLREVDPDVLVVAPCSFDRDQTRARADELTDRPGWDRLSAVRADRVHVLDGRALNRWTPRLGGELERLAGILHPDVLGVDPDAPTLS